MNTHRFGRSFIGIILALSIGISGAGLRLEAQQAESEAASKVSPDLAKVIKLFESGVGEDVVLAYVRSSPVPKPTADEIIQLHQVGIPASVITAMLSKNGTANTSAAPESVNSGHTPAKPPYEQSSSTPSVVYVDRSPTYTQPQTSVVYVPSYAPSYYSYPYYSYPYYYPSYYSWPAISLGFNFGGYYGHGYHGYHGYHGGGYHGYHGGGHHSGGGLHYVRH
jgi:hypothetical protein